MRKSNSFESIYYAEKSFAVNNRLKVVKYQTVKMMNLPQ
jgi:hypothetical protein